MTGGIDEVKDVDLSVIGVIFKADGAGFDCDSAFALDIHIIEELFFHIAEGDCFGLFEDSVREGRLTVVDVRDDAEIPYIFKIRLVRHCGKFLSLFDDKLKSENKPEIIKTVRNDG